MQDARSIHAVGRGALKCQQADSRARARRKRTVRIEFGRMDRNIGFRKKPEGYAEQRSSGDHSARSDRLHISRLPHLRTPRIVTKEPTTRNRRNEQ